VKGAAATSAAESVYRGGSRLGRRSAILGRLPSYGLIERAQNTAPAPTTSPKRSSD
jgi:hypothetical protein